jgi:type IV pilus assembly protein PilF
VVTLFVAFLCGCAADSAQQRRDADASYSLGLAFLQENRPSMALKELTKASLLAPTDPKIHNLLGWAYWRKQEYSAAEQAFRKAVEVDPAFSEAWNNLGALYIDQGRFEAAIPVLENAVNDVFYQTPERALSNLGLALYKTGRTAEAERRLRQAIEMAGDFPLAHKNLATLLQARDDHKAALTHLNEALVAMPNDAEIRLQQGISLLKLGRRAEAKDAFMEAWKLSPGTDLGASAKLYLELLQ